MRKSPTVIGYLIVFTGALAFAGNNVLAVFTFESGITPLTLVAWRMVFAFIALGLIIKIFGLAIHLPRRERNAALGLGILNGSIAFCLMSAFNHIAVGLAVLVFYFYPILTGIGAWLSGQEKLNIGVVIGLFGGFSGLAIALDFAGNSANSTGILFASLAAVLMALTALLSARILKTDNAQSVTLHIHLSGSVIFVIISLVVGDFSLPQTNLGWVGFISVAVLYTIAVATFFAGIAHIGPVRASLVMNLEPVGSIILGFILLGQVLSPQHILGAVIVIAAVTTVKWFGHNKKA